MRKMSKVLALLLILTMMLCLMASCSTGGDDASEESATNTIAATDSGNGDANEPVTIRVATFRSEDEDIFAEIISRFEEEYNWITVNWETNADTTAYYANLAADLEGGNGPDVFDMHPGTNFQNYIASGLISPQSGFEYLDTYQDYALAQTQVDGVNYGFMNAFNMICCIYNKTIFADLGLNAPTNYEELVAVVSSLKENGYGGVAYPGGIVAGDWFSNAARCTVAGASEYAALIDGIDDGSIVDVTDNNILLTALNTCKAWSDDDLFYDSSVSMTLDAELSLFAAEQCAVMIEGTWSLGTRDNDFPGIEIGLFPIFNSEGDSAYYGEGAQITCINAAIDDAQAEAAALWVNWIASVDIASYYSTNAGMSSTVAGVQIDFKDGDLVVEASKNVQLLPSPVLANSDYWNSDFRLMYTDALFNNLDPQTALADFSDLLVGLDLANVIS